MTIILDWLGPFTFTDLLNEPTPSKLEVPGVYLWIEKRQEWEQISYVGKATGRPGLLARQRKHYSNLIGGRYTIPEHFREGRQRWIPNQYPEDADILSDVEEFILLVRHAFHYGDHIKIFLAPLPHLVSEKLKVVERNLLYDLQPVGTAPGTKTIPKEKLQIQHRNAGWLRGAIKRNLNDKLVTV